MDIPCSGHTHRIEFTVSSAPNGWHRVDDRFGAFDRIPTRMDVRLFLTIDGRSLGYSLPGDSVRQDSSELLRGLYQLILSSFESLPPCLKGNAYGWAAWCRTLLQEMGRFRIDPYVARQFQNALALLVSGHSDERREVERHLALRALPVDTVDEELLRLMEQNREAIARAFMLPPDEVRHQYPANWDVGREEDTQRFGQVIEREPAEGWNPNASDEAGATAKALFEKTLPWAAKMLNENGYVWIAGHDNSLRYKIVKPDIDRINVWDVSSKEAYFGWLCLEVNAPDHWPVPKYDRLLQRLLLLQRDEKQVWRVAYFHSDGSKAAFQLMHQMGGRSYRLDSDRLPPVRYDGPVRYEPMTDKPQTYVDPVPVDHSHPSMQDILHRAMTGEWPYGA